MLKLRMLCGALALATALAFASILPARASQGSCVMPTTGTVSGLTFSQDVNACAEALITSNSGTSAPANGTGAAALAGQFWYKTSDGSLNLFDGASWLRLGSLDTTNHYWQAAIGGGTATIASATTTDLWSSAAGGITISGTTTITSLANASAVPGTIKLVRFSGALTLTHNATSLILPGGANIPTAAGDSMVVQALTTTNVAVLSYVKASGLPVVPLASIAAHTFLGNITGSTAVPSASSLSAILDAELGSTRGQIIYRGASTWGVLATGTSGQLLQTNGAGADPSWATVSAPVLLATLTASGSSSLADTTHLTSTYSRYEIVITNLIPSTNAVSARLKFNVGGVQSTNYDTTITYQNATDTAQTTFIPISRTVSLSSSSNGVNAVLTLMNPSQTTTTKSIFGTGTYKDTNSAAFSNMLIAGTWTGSNAAVTGFEVTPSSGTWASGTIKIYGQP